MFANSYDQEAAPQPGEGRDLPATFGESFADAWQNGQLATSGVKQSNARDQAVNEYIGQIKQAGGDFDGAYAKQISTIGGGDATYEPDALGVANDVTAAMQAKGVQLPFKPMTSDDIDARAVAISQQASAAHTGMAAREQSLSSRLGSFVGAAASATADPYNIPMLALPVEGLGILGTAAAFGGASALTQTANEAANASFNERVQPGYAASGQALGNIAEAGVSGAVLGGGVKTLGNLFTRLSTGAWPTASKDAANGIMSEAHTLDSNVLPGAEGEAAHQDALGTSIGQVLKDDPVDVSAAIAPDSDFANRIGDLSGEYGTTASIGGPYARETGRLNDRPNAETLMAFLKRNGGVQDSGGSLKAMDMIKGYPGLINKRGLDLDTARELAAEAGYLGPDTEEAMRSTDVNDLLDKLGEGKVYSSHDMAEVGRAGDAGKFNDFLDRRDDAVAEIQKHLSDQGEEPLDEEHADAAAEHRMEGSSIEDAIEHSAADLYVRDAAHARQFREAPEMPEIGYEAPTESPQGYAGEPGARDYYAGLGGRERPGAEGNLGAAQEPLRGDSPTSEEGRPRLLTSDDIRAQLAAPDAANAMRADIERAVDDAAKSGKALQVPIDIDANGEPIMGSVTSALGEIDRYNELADQVAACALPGAMQEAAE